MGYPFCNHGTSLEYFGPLLDKLFNRLLLTCVSMWPEWMQSSTAPDGLMLQQLPVVTKGNALRGVPISCWHQCYKNKAICYLENLSESTIILAGLLLRVFKWSPNYINKQETIQNEYSHGI